MAIRKKIGFIIDPLDLDTRISFGVKVPFSKEGVFHFNYTTMVQIKSNLINLLLTSPGERYHEPSYGVGIRDILFDQNSETNQRITTLKSRIDQSISFHLPQIQMTNLKVTPEDKILNIHIEYRILLDNDTNEISLTL